MAKEKEKVEQIVFTGEQVEQIFLALNELGWYDLFFLPKSQVLEGHEIFIYHGMRNKTIDKMSEEEIVINRKMNHYFQEIEFNFKKEIRLNPAKTKATGKSNIW